MRNDLTFVLWDRTESDRSIEDFNDMFDNIRKIVDNYGFDLTHFGQWETIRKEIELEERKKVLATLREFFKEVL